MNNCSALAFYLTEAKQESQQIYYSCIATLFSAQKKQKNVRIIRVSHH